ncbi:MAG: PrsW family glutamic-type intramembrane protease [Thermoplasmata archaeon]
MSLPLKWIVILIVSLVPALAYSIYIRNIEEYKKEPWRYVALAYLGGGITAVVFLSFSWFIYGQIEREHEYFQFFRSITNVFIIVILFPVLGEALKAVGLLTVKKELDEVEDGLIHGAILGLGFGAFANIVYLYNTFTWQFETVAGFEVPSLLFLIIAGISTILFHGSSTAAVGYGISSALVDHDYLHLGLYFFAGISIHLLFNLLNIITIYLEVQSGLYYLIGIGGVLLISNLVFRTIRARLLKLIEILDIETHKKRMEQKKTR